MKIKKRTRKTTKGWHRISYYGFGFLILFGILVVFRTVLLTKIPYFNIKSVKIVGDNNIDEEKILKILDLSGGVNIFSVNLESLKEKLLLSEPWIKTVQVARSLPSELIVNIKSREVVAIAKINNSLFYLDTDAIPVDKVSSLYNNDYIILENNVDTDFKEILNLGLELENLSKRKLYNLKVSEFTKEDENIYKVSLENTKTKIYISKEQFTLKLSYLDFVLSDLAKRREHAKIIYAVLPSLRFVVKGIKQ